MTPLPIQSTFQAGLQPATYQCRLLIISEANIMRRVGVTLDPFLVTELGSTIRFKALDKQVSF